jgi:hypothetical protein
VGAWLGFQASVQELRYHEGSLARELHTEYIEINHGQALIDKWRNASLAEQELLWLEWTGRTLDSEYWQNHTPLQPGEPMDFGSVRGLRPTAEELPQLKERGWITPRLEPLPLTPKGVWQIQHSRMISRLVYRIQEGQVEVVISTVVTSLLGFGLVWGVYAATRWVVWPVHAWISRGLLEDTK